MENKIRATLKLIGYCEFPSYAGAMLAVAVGMFFFQTPHQRLEPSIEIGTIAWWGIISFVIAIIPSKIAVEYAYYNLPPRRDFGEGWYRKSAILLILPFLLANFVGILICHTMWWLILYLIATVVALITKLFASVALICWVRRFKQRFRRMF